MKINFKSTRSIQLLVFLAFFLLVEIVLRLFGFKAGTLMDDFKFEKDPLYEQRFVSDELGINHLYPNAQNLMSGTIINAQGFRGRINYTPAVIDSIRSNSKKEIIMMVGDSFVEGCCADSVSNSFPDIIDRDKKYQVLNFGISGTDPLQYELVIKRYVNELKPDKVVVAFYFGNDIVSFNRVPSPNIPLTFPFKDNKWLFSVAPNHLSGKDSYVFKDYKEAYNFYLEHYTLDGNNRNWFEKTISISVIFSKIYLFVEHRIARWKWEYNHYDLRINGNDIMYKNVQGMANTCDSARVPFLFVGIPAPMEAEEGEELIKKYQSAFKNYKWYVPTNLKKEDYDGSTIANHLNKQGHKKYADFLRKLLNERAK